MVLLLGREIVGIEKCENRNRTIPELTSQRSSTVVLFSTVGQCGRISNSSVRPRHWRGNSRIDLSPTHLKGGRLFVESLAPSSAFISLVIHQAGHAAWSAPVAGAFKKRHRKSLKVSAQKVGRSIRYSTLSKTCYQKSSRIFTEKARSSVMPIMRTAIEWEVIAKFKHFDSTFCRRSRVSRRWIYQ
jgi:hypothetical protein